MYFSGSYCFVSEVTISCVADNEVIISICDHLSLPSSILFVSRVFPSRTTICHSVVLRSCTRLSGTTMFSVFCCITISTRLPAGISLLVEVTIAL